MSFGFLKTHIADFDHIVEAYNLFDKKSDGVLKVIVKVPK
jgi:threonine dehydrogenase-like Zn-dependent dehydrogenase